jgi:uncharacterized protein YgbK (DUF1537 family)
MIFAADDLSGATELAAGVAQSSTGKLKPRSVEIRLDIEDFEESPGNLVMPIVFDLDSRNASPKLVQNRTRALVESANKQAGSVFLKLDSILRGRIREHLLALSEYGPVIFCPALPSLGRLLVLDKMIISGVPLTETSLWESEKSRPPKTLFDLFEPGEIVSLHSGSYSNEKRLAEVLDLGTNSQRLYLANCASSEELDLLAQTIAKLSGVIPAGSGEFGKLYARALSNQSVSEAAKHPDLSLLPSAISRSRQPVIVVGSKSVESASQLAHLESLGIRITDLRKFAGSIDEFEGLIKATSPGLQCFTVSPESLSENKTGKSILALLSEHLSKRPLVLTGGATARGVLILLGVRRMYPTRELGHGQVIVQTDQGTLVAIKPGSFGEFDTLHKLEVQLHRPSGQRKA